MSNKIAPTNFSLLIGMSHHNQAVERSNTRYPGLQRFRQQIEEAREGPDHQPYQKRHKKAVGYRLIFFFFGMVFLGLFGLAYLQNINWTSSLLFANSGIPKLVLCGLCLLFAFVAFGMGLIIRTEKDAVNNIVHRAQKKLKQMYAHKSARLNLKSALSFEEQAKTSQAIKEIYNDTWEKIKESKEVAFTLIDEISQAKNLEAPIELYNQAILELNDRLNYLIHRFKNILNEDFDL